MRTSYLRWDAGVCQGSEYSEGFLTVQPDFYGEEASGGAGLAVQAPYGFLSRPLGPDDEGACQVLYAWEGSEGHALLGADARVLGKLPTLKKGGSMQFGSDGCFGEFNPETHTWTLYIPVAFDSAGEPTKSHVITVGKDGNGDRFIGIVHADGMGISMLEGDKNSVVIKNKAGDSFIELNDDGILLNGKKITIYGPVQVGGVAGLPVLTGPPGAPVPSPVMTA